MEIMEAGAYFQTMDNNAEQKQTITRYLLGEMSEQERSEFEDRYISDSVLFEELVAIEDEMMRSYVRGDLSESERLTFEARFLRNRGSRRRVDFSRSLMNYAMSRNEDASSRDQSHTAPHITANKPKREWQGMFVYVTGERSISPIITVAILLLLVSGGGVLAVKYIRVHREYKQMQAQHASNLRREQELREQLEKLTVRLEQQKQQLARNPAFDPTILSFTPNSHSIRQSSPQEPLIIRSEFSAILLRLTLRDDIFPSYTASLETPEGHRIWQQSGLKSWENSNGVHLIAVVLPSAVLKKGSYIVTLTGVAKGNPEEIDSYIFRVVRE